MIVPIPHDDDGTEVPACAVALVATSHGGLHFLVPSNQDECLTRDQLFLSAVAFRSTDPDWVEEQIEFIVEVRRQMDEREARGQIGRN